jgi:predicted RNase H-like HicB family nuclease
MLTAYIQTALKKATYEILEDGSFYAEIADCPGVLTNADTLEECREMLQDALEGWVLLGLQLGHELPVLDGIDLNMHQEVAA